MHLEKQIEVIFSWFIIQESNLRFKLRQKEKWKVHSEGLNFYEQVMNTFRLWEEVSWHFTETQIIWCFGIQYLKVMHITYITHKILHRGYPSEQDNKE